MPSSSGFETFRRDVSYAIRGLRREPGMSLIAIAILALGIGANTAVFSIVNPLLLKPLPFAEPERLVWIANTGSTGLSGRTYRVDVFEEFQRNTRSSESLTAYFAFFGFTGKTLTGRGSRPTSTRCGRGATRCRSSAACAAARRLPKRARSSRR